MAFKIGDRVTFKDDEKSYPASTGMADPFVVASLEPGPLSGTILVGDAAGRVAYADRLEPAPEPEPGIGQESYERSLATLRSVGAVFREQPPTWAELPQADRDAWDRCCACLADKIEPAPAPAEADTADRFAAQAHAFAVTSGEWDALYAWVRTGTPAWLALEQVILDDLARIDARRRAA